MSPYWMNNSCSPFLSPDGDCTLGHLASYAIDVTGAEDAAAGIRFAQEHNIRLTIKNTGHDFLGRSAGRGSLGLWMHNLKDVSFFEYTSPAYSGPAARIGAGVQFGELYATASAQGYRVVGGACPSVGATGGYLQGGGHGPLGAKYGLGSDQVLAWEVVTATGQHLTVSPTTEHADLYWAMSGGGAGNFAVAISAIVKAYPDGPVAGASFTFVNEDDASYWAAVSAWLAHLLVLDRVAGLTTLWGLSAYSMTLQFATLPDATGEDLTAALTPFFEEAEALNVTVQARLAATRPSFAEHMATWASQHYDTNNSIAGRLIPRRTVQEDLPALVAAFREITINSTRVGGSLISGISANVTHARVGNTGADNAVLPAWRDSLFTLTIGIPLTQDATWEEIRTGQDQLNEWQDLLRGVTPGGGTYMNEATYDNAKWKSDYFGANYGRLHSIKNKYDPNHLFWVEAGVGSDKNWAPAADGRLCPPVGCSRSRR